jgi:hypothetical protein
VAGGKYIAVAPKKRQDKGNGVFVYRLGHGPLKAERRVRFPYALPVVEINFDAGESCQFDD